MRSIKDMTSQEIKRLASPRGKEIMEKIANSKSKEEGILQNWLRASAAKELESKVNEYMDELKATPGLCNFLKDKQCLVVPQDEIKNEIQTFLTEEEIKVLAFEYMKIPIFTHIKAQSIPTRSYQAIAKTLNELYYCTEERTKQEIEQHFKSLRDNSYVLITLFYANNTLDITLHELPGIHGGGIGRFEFKCNFKVIRPGYLMLDKIKEITYYNLGNMRSLYSN